jgi:hypothetical protein
MIGLSLFIAFNCMSEAKFNGLDMNLGNLYRLSDAKTRSISPEKFTDEKGKGGSWHVMDPVRVERTRSKLNSLSIFVG